VAKFAHKITATGGAFSTAVNHRPPAGTRVKAENKDTPDQSYGKGIIDYASAGLAKKAPPAVGLWFFATPKQ
jgi:hypothetical protein